MYSTVLYTLRTIRNINIMCDTIVTTNKEDKIFVIGNWFPDAANAIQIYDVFNDTWALGPDLSEEYSELYVSMMCEYSQRTSRVYVFGGAYYNNNKY